MAKVRLAMGRALAGSAMLVCNLLASAHAQSTAEIAAYKGADRTSRLESGARNEGALALYAVGTQSDPVYQAFGKKYPFLKVDIVRADSPTMTRRLMEEYAAQTYLADAIELNTGAMAALKEAGILQAFDSPELAAYRKEAVEPGRHWALEYESYLSLGYNPKLVSDDQAPRTLDDLLDPKWRGKMAIAGTSTLANWVGALLRDKDEAFVRKLGAQQIKVFEISARAVANMVVSGEVPLSPTIFDSHMANSRDQGATVAWRALGGVYPSTNAVALASRAKHPHAALLYVDFALSKEGQEINQKLGNASGRTDIVNTSRPAHVYYLADEPNYVANYEKWLALGRQAFGK